jgi:tyrosine decarboxylase / aspartate 1-decarboxylase
MYWPRLTSNQINKRIFDALSRNLNYRSEKILGIPATFLDSDVFYEDAPFLKDAPFLSMLIANPNHIGCHTLPGDKEAVFKGTQEIERDLIRLCAEEIFGALPDQYDGYVASGGTEANIEAAWIYRNFFMKERGALPSEIALLFSEDTHYSFHKASNLLGIHAAVLAVDEQRQIRLRELKDTVLDLQLKGVKHFIVCINLSTTMFGSVDDISAVTTVLRDCNADFKLHVDGAFGGFIFPFTQQGELYGFRNPLVDSITIDGHKMLQSPYGTGIFLVRKNMMQYVCTEQASYVMGKDYTLCGSRSGANAVSVWMILHSHGSEGWRLKMNKLLDRTTALCAALDEMGVEYFRDPRVNIITIKSKYISPALAARFLLVPDNHEKPSWYKIVVMPHVRDGVLDSFKAQLAAELPLKHAS